MGIVPLSSFLFILASYFSLRFFFPYFCFQSTLLSGKRILFLLRDLFMFLSDIDLFTVLRRKSNVHFMHEIQSIAFQNYVYFMGGFMYLFIVL